MFQDLLSILTPKVKGVRLFPVSLPTAKYPKGKPLIKKWPTQASNDVRQLKIWHKRFESCGYNIGVVPAPKYFVFDIDVKDGKQGKESLKKLVAMGLSLDTFRVRTPSGGVHLYYKHPLGGVTAAMSPSWDAQFPGVDLRGDGTFVFSPLSVINKEYEIESDALPCRIPDSVIDVIPYKFKWTDHLSPTDEAAEEEYSGFVLPGKIVVGERDSVMFSYVCSLVVKGGSKASITKACKEAFKRVEQPKGNEFLWDVVEKMISRAIAQYGKVSNSDVSEQEEESLPRLLRQSLERYVLVANGNLVGDLQAPPGSDLLTLKHWTVLHNNVWVKKYKKPLPSLWVSNPKRRSVYKTDYFPSEDRIIKLPNGTEFFNTYVPPRKSIEGTKSSIQTVLDHIKYLLDENGQDAVRRFIKWLAFTVTRPEVKIPWAPLIVSKHYGLGKGWLYQLFQLLLGVENCSVIGPDDLSDRNSQYNEWLGGTLLCINELEPKYNFYEKLKTIVSDTSGPINNKYGTKGQRTWFANVIAFSNHDNALSLSMNDRRWWVLACRKPPQPPEYFIKLFEWLKGDGPYIFRHFLEKVDLSTYTYAATPPMTQAKEVMVETARSQAEVLLRDAYELEQGPFVKDIICVESVRSYVLNELELDKLTFFEMSTISRFLSEVSVADMPQHRYSIKKSNRTVRKSLYMIRNKEKWLKASTEEIVKYYTGGRK